MDKRKGKRYECDIDVHLSYAEVPGEVIGMVKNSYKGRIKNISLKGVLIEIDNCVEIKKGMALNVEVIKGNIRCVCVVRHVASSIGCQVICFPTSKMHGEYNKIVENRCFY